MKKVILEGGNGEWARKHYLPVLVRKAAEGGIELWVVDIEDSIKLSTSEIEKDWQVAQSKNRARYLNKSKDMQNYRELSNTDYIFIVVPDQFHSEIAAFWLERLAPGGKVFIEKLLDTSVRAACGLKETIEGKGGKEAIFAFDHYLARAYPFLHDKDYYLMLKQIGGVKNIEFHILEDSRISPQREKTLDKGMIFDLFCHVLALVCAVVNQNLTCSATMLQTVRLEKVEAAQYVGSPISGETFARIKFIVNNDIEVDSAVGKCIGTSKDKFMELYGPNGSVKLDFVKDEYSVIDSQGRQQKQGGLDSKHVETFLEGVLQGKQHSLLLPGVLSFDAALETLTILDEAKKQIDEIPEYQCHESVSDILERF